MEFVLLKKYKYVIIIKITFNIYNSVWDDKLWIGGCFTFSMII